MCGERRASRKVHRVGGSWRSQALCRVSSGHKSKIYRLQARLQRRVAERITQWPRIGHGVVRRQLRDDHVEHARLPASMQPHARCVVHDLTQAG